MEHLADRRLSDTAAAQHGVFSIVDARGAGLTHGEIDLRSRERWSRIYDGVFRVTGAPVTWRGELLAATFAGGAGSAISHRAGAELYGLPGGRRELVELSCVRWKRTVRPGLVVHESRRLDSRDIQLVDGIPVTTPERTILDLASCYPAANYLELVIQAARRKRLITYESMHATFERHARRGLKGVRALRGTLERWDPNSRATDSDMETLLLQAVRANGLAEPVIQFDVLDEAGRFVARADAAYPDARIVIEYDSKQEHSDEFQIAHDARRRNKMQTCGYFVISARHADLKLGGTELCDELQQIMRRNKSEPA